MAITTIDPIWQLAAAAVDDQEQLQPTHHHSHQTRQALQVVATTIPLPMTSQHQLAQLSAVLDLIQQLVDVQQDSVVFHLKLALLHLIQLQDNQLELVDFHHSLLQDDQDRVDLVDQLQSAQLADSVDQQRLDQLAVALVV